MGGQGLSRVSALRAELPELWMVRWGRMPCGLGHVLKLPVKWEKRGCGVHSSARHLVQGVGIHQLLGLRSWEPTLSGGFCHCRTLVRELASHSQVCHGLDTHTHTHTGEF